MAGLCRPVAPNHSISARTRAPSFPYRRFTSVHNDVSRGAHDGARVGDLAAPISFRLNRRVTRSWCQIQLTITTAMHADSLVGITMSPGQRTTFGRSVRCRPSCDRQASRPVAHQLADMRRTSVVGSHRVHTHSFANRSATVHSAG